MKKLILILSLVLSVAFGAKAEVDAVEMVTWEGSIYNAKPGSNNGTGYQSESHWRIKLNNQGNGTWSYDFDPAVAVKYGEKFCIRIHHNDGTADEWRHSGLAYPEKNGISFQEAGDGNDMTFSKDGNIKSISFSWTNDATYPYTMNVEFTNSTEPDVDPNQGAYQPKKLDSVVLVTWAGSIFDNKSGNGYTEGSHWRINLSAQSDGTWKYTFPNNGVHVNKGDEFCLYINNDWEHAGTHSNLYYPAQNYQWYREAGDSKNMKFSQSGTLKSISYVEYQEDATYGHKLWVEFDSDTPDETSSPSRYSIQVWATAQDGNYRKWDKASGLYAPFDSSYKKGAGENQTVTGSYPLHADYKFEETIDKMDYKFLNFYGPLSPVEIASINSNYAEDVPHAVHWAMKNGQEDETELYVIDFCKGNNERGLYIEVPTVEEMLVNQQDPYGDGMDATPNFFRMGMRFGFMDRSYDGTRIEAFDDHLRFVKWGHVFRLNEQSRPLNAFPVLNTNGKDIQYFSDEYGPTEWNGLYSGENSNWTSKTTADLKAKNNKIGDSRLLAERNFWLKRIFLEVAYADQEKRYKRFYIYFDGEYDLNGSARSFGQDFFAPVDMDDETHGNYVTGTPNIFRGANLAANEAGFNRFHNLELNRAEELIGITESEYQDYRGENNYLYDLDFTAPYTVTSTYGASNASGPLQYSHNGTEVNKTIHYAGKGGKFYGLDDDKSDLTDIDNYNQYIDSHSDADDRAVVEALGSSIIFDSESDAYMTTTIDVEGTYSFPNMAFPTVIVDSYEFNYDLPTLQATIPLNAYTETRHADFRDFTSTIDWSGFNSLKNADNDIYPVSNYVVKAVGSTQDFRTGDNGAIDIAALESKYVFENVDGNANVDDEDEVMLDHNNNFWLDNSDQGIKSHRFYLDNHENSDEPIKNGDTYQDYYVYYKVISSYNLCYPTEGKLFPSELLFDDNGAPTELLEYDYPTSSEAEATPQSANKSVKRRAGEGDTTEYASQLLEPRTVKAQGMDGNEPVEVEYNIQPQELIGYAVAVFSQGTTTNIGEVAVDGEAAGAEAVYYNLQGVRVARPEAGQVMIVRRGASVTKELIH